MASHDQVEVRVVPLKAVSILAPITRIIAGGRMPLRAVGLPGTNSLLRLGSTPPARFTWGLSQDSSAEIQSALHPLGLHVPDTDLVAVQLHALKPGRVTVSLTVQVCGCNVNALRSLGTSDGLKQTVHLLKKNYHCLVFFVFLASLFFSFTILIARILKFSDVHCY